MPKPKFRVWRCPRGHVVSSTRVALKDKDSGTGYCPSCNNAHRVEIKAKLETRK